MTPNAQHKRAERERRKAAGEVRVETWCSLEQISVLDMDPISRANAVKVLIDRVINDQAQTLPLTEADS